MRRGRIRPAAELIEVITGTRARPSARSSMRVIPGSASATLNASTNELGYSAEDVARLREQKVVA
jgi:hypothetical protein